MTENYHLILPDTIKLVEVNSFSSFNDTSFLNGLKNAQNLVKDLEQSLQKTSEYENRLLKCKATHFHKHDTDGWWKRDTLDQSSYLKTDTKQYVSREHVGLTETWSTMSIVCLQYQYEELAKKYEALLQTYDEQRKALNTKNASLEKLATRLRTTRSQVNQAHKALLTVGEKYFTLKRRQEEKENQYDQSIEMLKASLSSLLAAATRARLDLDEHIERAMVFEKDVAVSQLLAETRRCNRLYLENLRLKAMLDELTPSE